MERTFEHLLETVKRAQKNGQKCTILVGAGCSKTAGIPLASEIIDEIKAEHPATYSAALKGGKANYQDLMGELSTADRKNLISNYVDEANLNWAHICLAMLMREKYVDIVLTTNFDPLAVKAAALMNTFPAIYDIATLNMNFYKSYFVDKLAIFYLNGQISGFVQVNASAEFDDHNPLGPIIENCIKDKPLIIVGYSGENDNVFQQFKKTHRFDGKLYWIGYKDSDPAPHLKDNFLGKDKDAFYVRGYDADSFFIKLAQSLGCFPPPFLEKPFSHLKETLSKLVNEYSDPGSNAHLNIVEVSNAMIDKAIKEIESGEKPEEASALTARAIVPLKTVQAGQRGVVKVKKEGDVPLRQILQIGASFMALNYDKVIELAKDIMDSLPGEVLDTVAWAYVELGNKEFSKARLASSQEAIMLYKNAGMLFKKALEISVNHAVAFYNWGNALSGQANLKSGDEADALFKQAYEKYEAALKIKPDYHEALNNWGSALSRQANLKSGDEADALFKQAYEKYEAASKLKPEMSEAPNNWGLALASQAKLKSGVEADVLVSRAYDKFEVARKNRPDSCEVFYNWGNVLAGQAKSKPGDEADSYFKNAYEKYEVALKINPEYTNALHNWGSALSDQAMQKTGDEADALFKQAIEKYTAALKIKSDDHEALNNWGIALSGQANLKSGDEADALFTQAIEKYKAALKIKPDDHEALNNWGAVISAQAKQETGEKADALFTQAYEKYEVAIKIKPDNHKVLNNWGLALSSQANLKSGNEADALFTQAIEKYMATLEIKPTDHVTFNNWGSALIGQANQKSGEEASKLFSLAREKCLQSEKIKKGIGAYNLACIESLQGNEGECRKWLETCREASSNLPTLEHMQKDKDLVPMRGKQWFENFLDTLKK